MYRLIVMYHLLECTEQNITYTQAGIKRLAGSLRGLLSVEVEPSQPRGDSACDICANFLFESKAAMDQNHGMLTACLGAREDGVYSRITTAEYPIATQAQRIPRLYAAIGPSNRDEETLGRLMDAGMSGIRISLEHHAIEETLPILEALHTACASRGISGEVLLYPHATTGLMEYVRQAGATGIIVDMPTDGQGLRDLRALLGPKVRLLCKVDCREQVDALQGMLADMDEVIIARSAMNRKVPRHEIPAVQRRVASVCRNEGKPFMIATDLLLSMRGNPFPSIAELDDIYYAVQEGVAALMLGREVTVGRYPVEAMRTLRKTVEAALLTS